MLTVPHMSMPACLALAVHRSVITQVLVERHAGVDLVVMRVGGHHLQQAVWPAAPGRPVIEGTIDGPLVDRHGRDRDVAAVLTEPAAGPR